MTLNGPFAAGTTGTMKTKQGTRQIQLADVVPGRSFRLETTVVPLTRFAFEWLLQGLARQAEATAEPNFSRQAASALEAGKSFEPAQGTASAVLLAPRG